MAAAIAFPSRAKTIAPEGSSQYPLAKLLSCELPFGSRLDWMAAGLQFSKSSTPATTKPK